MNLVEFIFKESNKLASGSKTAICFHDEEISYDMLYSRVRRAAGVFRSAGIKSGERVAIVLGDGPDFIVSFLGCVAAGAVAVPVNTMLPGDVLGYILSNCGANNIVAGADQIKKLTFAQANLNSLRNIWISGPGGTNQYEFEGGESTPRLEGFQAAVQGTEETDIVGAADETLAFILYTSGSTGPPKGAIHLHRSIPLMVATACRQVLVIGPDDRLFSSSRLFFAYGLGNGLYFPLSSGATSILSDSKPDPAAIGGVLKRYRPTIFFGVPAIYKSLCQHISDGNPVDTMSLRFCVSAGERLPATVFHEWKRLTGLDIVDHIGATEMLQMFISNRPDRIKPGSAGRPIPGCEVRILDETGAEIIGPGVGELAARSGSAFAGYFNDPVRTSATLKDGWVYTRDIFRRDVDGDYWFEGRADDLFKVKGQWVSPVEVEEAILSCGEVHEVAVVAGTDETGLGSTVAFVVPSPGNAPGPELAELLTRLISSRLPPYKRPSEFRFVNALPRTATGKIQRFKLREPPGPFVQRSGG